MQCLASLPVCQRSAAAQRISFAVPLLQLLSLLAPAADADADAAQPLKSAVADAKAAAVCCCTYLLLFNYCADVRRGSDPRL
jgi:hypothetical protein